mmetsp:Transcript_34749/g.107514  ORF Transcript_34749/g.107514 Transcript_34749/m.107514 type:complete len:185 (+) Transcript_34749:397-951(+)
MRAAALIVLLCATTRAREYAKVGRVCRPKNGDGYETLEAELDDCKARCDGDPKCGAYEYENYSADFKECELHESTIIDASLTEAEGPCEAGDATTNYGYRCCNIDIALLAAPTGPPAPKPSAEPSADPSASATPSGTVTPTPSGTVTPTSEEPTPEPTGKKSDAASALGPAGPALLAAAGLLFL